MSNRELEPTGKSPAKLLSWNPKPVTVPEINPKAFERHPLVRASEILRYSLHRLEYWVSPNGMLREWLRLNLLLAFLVGITGIILAPLVTILLGEIAEWIQLILQIVTGLVSIALAAIFFFVLLRVFVTLKNKFRRGDQDQR